MVLVASGSKNFVAHSHLVFVNNRIYPPLDIIDMPDRLGILHLEFCFDGKDSIFLDLGIMPLI